MSAAFQPAVTPAAPQPLTVYRVGPFELVPDMRRLTGPLGVMFIQGRQFALLERLMRRPGVVVQSTDLIAAIWPEPDEEPEDAQGGLRNAVWWTRRMLEMLSAGTEAPTIQNVLDVGYTMRGNP